MISSIDIREKLLSLWPNLGGWFKGNRIWLRNHNYNMPSLSQLSEALDKCRIDLPWIKGLNECENFALILHAKVKEHQVRQFPNDRYTWAFGDFVAKRRGLLGDTIHAACFCFTQSGFYIIEPKTSGNEIKELQDGYKAIFISM